LPQSPKPALPLAEAFVELMRPSAELIEVAKRKAASRGQEDWRVCLLERAVAATTHIASGHAPSSWVEEAAALLAGFRRLMANDEARAIGLEGSLLGSKRELSAGLWDHLVIRGDGTLELPGAPPIRFYSVVIKLKKPSKRGAPGYREADMPLVFEMREMILADPKLTPMAAAWHFADRAPGGGALLIKARRLRDLYGEEFES
jgi:hypothetical protein